MILRVADWDVFGVAYYEFNLWNKKRKIFFSKNSRVFGFADYQFHLQNIKKSKCQKTLFKSDSEFDLLNTKIIFVPHFEIRVSRWQWFRMWPQKFKIADIKYIVFNKWKWHFMFSGLLMTNLIFKIKITKILLIRIFRVVDYEFPHQNSKKWTSLYKSENVSSYYELRRFQDLWNSKKNLLFFVPNFEFLGIANYKFHLQNLKWRTQWKRTLFKNETYEVLNFEIEVADLLRGITTI